MLVVLVITVLLVLSRRFRGNNYYNNKPFLTVDLSPDYNATVTDHIPVGDNPVYITMKKIDMNRNSAYEMVHLGDTLNL